MRKFISPHKTKVDCAICSLAFLNVLPNHIIDKMIDETTSRGGITDQEIIYYFQQAYGYNHNFKWIPSESFITTNGDYKKSYMNDYLNLLNSLMKPGYAILLDLKRFDSPGHFMVLGKTMDDLLVLFEPQYDPKKEKLGMYSGNEDIINHFIRSNIFFILVLDSNLIESHTNISKEMIVPMDSDDIQSRMFIRLKVDEEYEKEHSNLYKKIKRKQEQKERREAMLNTPVPMNLSS